MAASALSLLVYWCHIVFLESLSICVYVMQFCGREPHHLSIMQFVAAYVMEKVLLASQETSCVGMFTDVISRVCDNSVLTPDSQETKSIRMFTCTWCVVAMFFCH